MSRWTIVLVVLKLIIYFFLYYKKFGHKILQKYAQKIILEKKILSYDKFSLFPKNYFLAIWATPDSDSYW